VAGRAAERDGSVRLTVAATPGLLRHVGEKGSVTVDGVSLTVTAVADDRFEVALIPHTLAVTTLGARQPGDGVNLETDLVAKYVERLLDPAALGR
jgi:riboflavin synthase